MGARSRPQREYPRFIKGMTRVERQDATTGPADEPGCGARYRLLMHVGSADVGGLIEIVEFDTGRDLAWTSITGIDQRGRWRLREAGRRAYPRDPADELRRAWRTWSARSPSGWRRAR